MPLPWKVGWRLWVLSCSWERGENLDNTYFCRSGSMASFQGSSLKEAKQFGECLGASDQPREFAKSCLSLGNVLHFCLWWFSG